MKRLRTNRETGITLGLGLTALLVVALGFVLAVKPQQDEAADLSDEIAALVDSGAIRPVVGITYPFEETPAALAALGSTGTRGKAVITRS